jgi:hypothetical protein
MAAVDLDKEMGTMENRFYDLRCQAHASRLLQKESESATNAAVPGETAQLEVGMASCACSGHSGDGLRSRFTNFANFTKCLE